MPNPDAGIRSIISAKMAFWLIPNPIPNRHMPAITATGKTSQIITIIPADAIASPGISRPA